MHVLFYLSFLKIVDNEILIRKEEDRFRTSFLGYESVVATPTEIAKFIAFLLLEDLYEIC